VVKEALMSTISAIKDEINTRIQYWNDRSESKTDHFIEEIILCGGSSNLKGLPEYFSQSLNIETKRANVWTNAFSIDSYIPPIDQPHSLGYATAIGLGLAAYSS